jgi:hypothetical protein
MDLNNARGLVAIRKDNFALQKVRSSRPFWNNPEYWLYNVSDVPKYRVVQIDISEAQDGSDMVDSAAMREGITNLLQVGDLPTLGGSIQPAKYWQLKADGSKPILKSPAERTAVDAAEAQEKTRKDRKALIERRIAKRQRRIAARELKADGVITQAELDEIEAEA